MWGSHFGVFRLDQKGCSSLRGQICEEWEVSASLCLEPMKTDPPRCAVGDPPGNSLTLCRCATLGTGRKANATQAAEDPNAPTWAPHSGLNNTQIAILPTTALIKPLCRVSSELAQTILNVLLCSELPTRISACGRWANPPGPISNMILI